VLSKALARDREQRYLKAGDFAKDLSIVLDRLGKPVTYQDLAALVLATAGERTKKRPGERDAAGMVGDLILDALHDFSGGAGETAPSSLGTRGIERPAAGGDFVNPSDWGLSALFDDAPGPAPTVRSAGPPVPPPASTSPAPKPPAPPTAAQRARPPASSPAAEGGPFWRRWFGG
jgi:hypothetical protein